jgi:MFS family permease
MTSQASPWSPFRHPAFAVIWTATVVSNIGSWMYSAASAWLMTTLDSDPRTVALVQVASSLPIFLFAIPAGAIADIVDKRRFLLACEIVITAVSFVFAGLVALDLVTPAVLLAFAFVLGVGGAVTAPPYQSIVPLLVPRTDLTQAVAANSVGVNISRAIGPAAGGVITAVAGIAAPFWINAASNLASVGALAWWQAPQARGRQLPAERFFGAIRTGIRYARNNPHLRATIVRAIAFFLFASAYWALLPLVARNQVAGGADLYGVLVGTIGVGAVCGAFLLPWLRSTLHADGVVAAGSAGTAIALILFAIAAHPAVAIAACFLAGIAWIAVLSGLNVSAQVALPEWVRSRGLAVYVTAFFGAMSFGSYFWGYVASATSLPVAHWLAAAGALAAIPLTWGWKLQTGAAMNFAPSAHWPAPVLSGEIADDAGPVLVTVEYHVPAEHRDLFLVDIRRIEHERRRDGAYSWAVFEDVAVAGRFIETFHVESWLEHLRQHERVTETDREVEMRVRKYVTEEPRITHMIAAESHRPAAVDPLAPR